MVELLIRFENPDDKEHDKGAELHAESKGRVDNPDGTVTVKAEEGYSLLETLIMNNVNLNHNCGGVCACTTCHLYVEKGDDLLEEISDKEEDYIDRATNPRLESRLGCQCVLNESEGNVEIIVPDQSGIIGHEH